MFPDRKIWLIPFPVTIPMKIYVIGAGAIEFFLTLGSGGGDNVSHVTHLGGMLVGYLYLRRGSWFYRARNGISDWQRKRARRKFEVYMRKHRKSRPHAPTTGSTDEVGSSASKPDELSGSDRRPSATPARRRR